MRVVYVASRPDLFAVPLRDKRSASRVFWVKIEEGVQVTGFRVPV